MAQPPLQYVQDLSRALSAGNPFDALVLVGPVDATRRVPFAGEAIARLMEVDAGVLDTVMLLRAPGVPGERLIHGPIPSLTKDHDDVRRFADTANRAMERARRAGAKRPLLVVAGRPNRALFARATEASLLGALAALWQPLEAREARGEAEVEPVQVLGFHATETIDGAMVQRIVQALELGRRLARDITGTEPERMRPEAMAATCLAAFEGTAVRVHVLDDQEAIRQRYPLVHAVARASLSVPRHRPCIIRLEYTGEGPIDRSLFFAGKGLSYDTGGADLKVNGVMAGMSRDKGGAGAVAGFLRTIAALEPKGLRVVAEIGAVRNSIGADAFVSDEIITAHCGTRVRIGNTDAEGRLVLADLLSHLREEALHSQNPRLFSIATLTGHSYRAVGPYGIAIDNGPAAGLAMAERLARAGELFGDPLEVSKLRREDWDFVRPRSLADDVLSCNNAASSATARGHQFPMAFLCLASGLDRHGGDSERPIPFTHLDIGGSACEGADWQHGKPTGTPVVALTAALLD